MEDVLQNSPQTSKRPAGDAGATRSASEPASWTTRGGSADGEVFSRPSLPYPLNALFSLVESHRDYHIGCQNMAVFLKKLSGHHSLEDLMLQVIQARFPRVWMERFLFILLEVQASDWQTAGYALQFRHLKRLLLRVERKTPLNTVESGLARELISALALSRFQDFEPFCRRAVDTFKSLQAGHLAVSGDLGLLIYLLRCECSAMGERKNWLESDLGSGDPETVARLTPHLKLLEDRMHKAQEMAQRLGGYGAIQDGSAGLEEAMGPFFYAHFTDGLKAPGLSGLKEALAMQRAKRVPTRDLIALSSLCRWLCEARGASAGPLEWVRMALAAYDRGHFRLDVAGGLPAVEALLSEARVERDGTLVLGNFGENPYSSWIARDDLTRPYRSSNPDRISPDVKSLVASNLHRDGVILKMLDSAKVYQTPGLVEAVVEGSRSSLVHSKIAARSELHAGPANGRVPLALLRSGVSIPGALLKSLIHPSLIAFSEMKVLYRAKSALRPEVADELHAFLKQAYAI